MKQKEALLFLLQTICISNNTRTKRQGRRRRMRCASRTPPRRHQASDPSSGDQDSPPQARDSKGRNNRSKRVPPAGRDCPGEDPRVSRKGEGRENVAGATVQARAKRRFKISGTMFEASCADEFGACVRERPGTEAKIVWEHPAPPPCK